MPVVMKSAPTAVISARSIDTELKLFDLVANIHYFFLVGGGTVFDTSIFSTCLREGLLAGLGLDGAVRSGVRVGVGLGGGFLLMGNLAMVGSSQRTL
jgi:hypothetical protein